MRTVLITFLFIFGLNFLSFSQNSKTFKLSEFHHLETQRIHDLSLIPSKNNSLKVTGKVECIELLKQSEQGSTLRLYFDDDKISSMNFGRLRCEPEFELYYKSLESVDIDRGFNIKGNIHPRNNLLKLTSHTSGSLDLSVSVDSIDVKILGSVNVKISGKSNYQSVTIEGAGRYQALKYFTKSASINVRKAATARINVSDTLKVFSEGASRIFYMGDPKIIQKEVIEPSMLRKIK